MTEQPDLSTLAQRARYAAGVIDEVNVRRGAPDVPPLYYRDYSWSPSELRNRADRWEVEDRAVAERDALVEQLAEVIAGGRGYQVYLNSLNALDQSECRNLARHIIKKGWTTS